MKGKDEKGKVSSVCLRGFVFDGTVGDGDRGKLAVGAVHTPV